MNTFVISSDLIKDFQSKYNKCNCTCHTITLNELAAEFHIEGNMILSLLVLLDIPVFGEEVSLISRGIWCREDK